MGSLYIRLRTGFFTHRKTIRLRALIGEDAFWIPPKLWCYAAENQPDGDMSSYSSEELSMLLGCCKHATSIREALLQAGFLDPDGHIHDWDEHNGYHEKFATRAKLAAEARWASKKEKNQKKEERDKDKDRDKEKETSIAPSMLDGCLKHDGVSNGPVTACNAESVTPTPASDPEKGNAKGKRDEKESIEYKIYMAYPLHKEPKDALKAIRATLAVVDSKSLLEATVAYCEATKKWSPSQRKYIPYPASWFNAGGYDDDRSTWVKEPAPGPTGGRDAALRNPRNARLAGFDQWYDAFEKDPGHAPDDPPFVSRREPGVAEEVPEAGRGTPPEGGKVGEVDRMVH